MQINDEPKKRFVDYYDFTFTHGIQKQVMIDKSIGDTIEFINGGVQIYLVARPGLGNPEDIIPAEDVTIFAQNLLAIDHRKILVEEMTPEQKVEWQQTVKDISKFVH